MTAVPPLVVSFDVAVPVAHAFSVWFERTALWWPRGHTVTGDPAAIEFEPRVGGRIVERGADGVEHAWGEITAWDPPRRAAFWWHLFFDRAEATLVEIAFVARGDGTQVRLEQTGWDALGDHGAPRRERTAHGWAAVTAPYRALLEAP